VVVFVYVMEAYSFPGHTQADSGLVDPFSKPLGMATGQVSTFPPKAQQATNHSLGPGFPYHCRPITAFGRHAS
jgi:hypothetical protein